MPKATNISYLIPSCEDDSIAVALVAVNVRNIADQAGTGHAYTQRLVRQRLDSLFEDLNIPGVKCVEREDIDDDWEI